MNNGELSGYDGLGEEMNHGGEGRASEWRGTLEHLVERGGRIKD